MSCDLGGEVCNGVGGSDMWYICKSPLIDSHIDNHAASVLLRG